MITTKKMRNIVAQIAEVDQKFIPIIETSELCELGRFESEMSHFESLVSSVISQQLATSAARTIKNNFKSTVGRVTPKNVARLDQNELRAAGLSNAKTRAIQGLALASLDGSIKFERLHDDSDELVYQKLTSLWGIGPWTVDMFMMFQLGRLDIWPTGDLGVRRGWEEIHRMRKEITPNDLQRAGAKFRPHRSVVAWYCWRATEK